MLNITETREDNRQLLLAHHTDLDAQLEQLIYEARRGDWPIISQCFSRLANDLSSHMADEEKCMIAEFARSHPTEARAILDEHVEIRKLLDNVGVGIDLHLFRFETAENLAERLRKHSRREDALLYPWAAARNISLPG
jgi:hypothetical protein